MGFDSFVVMRHGIHDTQPSGEKVGCYYCNDVVAPMDSMSDRTLDQQCTVTRPGLSAIASALAVELLITLLHHPLQASAPADTQTSAVPLEPQSMLGYVPHQIRGFMREWKQVLISGRSYDKCTACSSTIIDAYRKDGYSFIASALKDPMLLERMVGLDVLKQQSELVDIDWDDDD
jgi:ubiquitin-like modifier-activating enzyme ATG7